MKTSIPETIEIEKYLQRRMEAGDSLIFQGRLLVDERLRSNTIFQRMVHRLVLLYYRKRLKARVRAVHHKLFTDPDRVDFREDIMKIFNT